MIETVDDCLLSEDVTWLFTACSVIGLQPRNMMSTYTDCRPILWPSQSSIFSLIYLHFRRCTLDLGRALLYIISLVLRRSHAALCAHGLAVMRCDASHGDASCCSQSVPSRRAPSEIGHGRRLTLPLFVIVLRRQLIVIIAWSVLLRRDDVIDDVTAVHRHADSTLVTFVRQRQFRWIRGYFYVPSKKQVLWSIAYSWQ